jgi:hypothetical protein
MQAGASRRAAVARGRRKITRSRDVSCHDQPRHSQALAAGQCSPKTVARRHPCDPRRPQTRPGGDRTLRRMHPLQRPADSAARQGGEVNIDKTIAKPTGPFQIEGEGVTSITFHLVRASASGGAVQTFDAGTEPGCLSASASGRSGPPNPCGFSRDRGD